SKPSAAPRDPGHFLPGHPLVHLPGGRDLDPAPLAGDRAQTRAIEGTRPGRAGDDRLGGGRAGGAEAAQAAAGGAGASGRAAHGTSTASKTRRRVSSASPSSASAS